MFKSIKHKFLLFFACFLVFLFSCFLAMGQGVLAADKYGLENTAQHGYGNGGNIPTSVKATLSERVGTIVGAGLAFIGVIFFVLMIYGGFLWMTAAGNEQQVEKAKTLVVSAIIGIIIVMSAYAITAYIGGALTSS